MKLFGVSCALFVLFNLVGIVQANLGPIYNISDVTPDNLATITCSQTGQGGCLVQAGSGTTIETTNPISFCEDGQAAWSPRQPPMDTLEISSCGGDGDCSIQCTADCNCTLSEDGSDCPTRPTLSGSTATPRAPFLPATCTAEEQMRLDDSYSPICPNIMSSAIPACPCTFIYCNGNFLGCGPRSIIECIGSVALLERCVYSDRMCPLAPTMAPTSPMPTPSPPSCASIMVTDLGSCKSACNTGSGQTTINNGRVTCICSGVTICRDLVAQPTMAPTSGGISLMKQQSAIAMGGLGFAAMMFF